MQGVGEGGKTAYRQGENIRTKNKNRISEQKWGKLPKKTTKDGKEHSGTKRKMKEKVKKKKKRM